MKNVWVNVSNVFKKVKIKPVIAIVLSFLIAILIGSGLLYAPFSLKEGVKISYIDALFTSTSATCVTGLVSIKAGVAETFSLAGRIIIAILIQLGGLGVTTLAVAVFMIANKKLTFNEQSLIKESWNLKNYQGIRGVFFKIILLSFSFELFGAFLSFFDFYFWHNNPMDPMNPWTLQEAIGYSFFHSISAFNNAGFDLFGTSSLIVFEQVGDIYINLVTAFLIISGGLGFLVMIDMVTKKFNFKRFSLHSKIVLTFTIALILSGMFITYLTELGNKNDFGFLGSYFLSVSTRTAGFTTYDLSKFRDSTLIIYMFLMFVGASPGGTGGGVKTTTFALFVAYMRGILTDRRPYYFKRTISKALVRKALLIIILGLLFVLVGGTIICGVEGNLNYVKDGISSTEYIEGANAFTSIDHAFEAMSAFGTVGLSTGYTPYYHTASKIVLITLMYVGRLGPLTVSTMFKAKNPQLYRYVEEDVSIG